MTIFNFYKNRMLYIKIYLFKKKSPSYDQLMAGLLCITHLVYDTITRNPKPQTYCYCVVI
jgi:hypothetical protein